MTTQIEKAHLVEISFVMEGDRSTIGFTTDGYSDLKNRNTKETYEQGTGNLSAAEW